MDRRSFLVTLIGGMAAASIGGLAVAEAAQPQAAPAPAPVPTAAHDEDAVTAEMADALDKSEADYSQYYYHRRRPRYYARPRYYRRPPVYYRPRAYYRPRRYYRGRYW